MTLRLCFCGCPSSLQSLAVGRMCGTCGDWHPRQSDLREIDTNKMNIVITSDVLI